MTFVNFHSLIPPWHGKISTLIFDVQIPRYCILNANLYNTTVIIIELDKNSQNFSRTHKMDEFLEDLLSLIFDKYNIHYPLHKLKHCQIYPIIRQRRYFIADRCTIGAFSINANCCTPQFRSLQSHEMSLIKPTVPEQWEKKRIQLNGLVIDPSVV